MTHDSACCARASNISGLLHSNSYINHALNLDCSEAARLHSHTIQFILWTMPLPPIFVYCVLSFFRQLYYRITHCVICMWHPLLMSVLRPQYRITTCISVIWFFLCHVDLQTLLLSVLRQQYSITTCIIYVSRFLQTWILSVMRQHNHCQILLLDQQSQLSSGRRKLCMHVCVYCVVNSEL